MAIDYFLSLSSAVPLRAIDGVPHSIWTYTLMWPERLSRRGLIDPGPRLAVVFSSRINIRDPKALPDVPEIQDTQLEKPGGGDIQYVCRDIQGRVGNTIALCFVAPSAVDTFTPRKACSAIVTVGAMERPVVQSSARRSSSSSAGDIGAGSGLPYHVLRWTRS